MADELSETIYKGDVDGMLMILQKALMDGVGEYLASTESEDVAPDKVIACVEKLLDVPGIDVNYGRNGDGTILTLSAYYNCTSLVDFLLKRDDIDVNAIDHNGKTPLMASLIENDGSDDSNDVAKLLLKTKGINLQYEHKGSTALSIAKEYNNEEMIRLIPIAIKDQDTIKSLKRDIKSQNDSKVFRTRLE